jgi:NAD(P)-dependent dehydrogenase (short-subunit alcohol dehydrogenase family)
MSKADRRCLVVGATGALGSSVVKVFRREGYEVIGLSRSRPKDWDDEYIECDLSDLNSLAAAEAPLRDLGPIDVLVNCAGLGKGGVLGKIDPDALVAVMMTNAIGPALIANHVAPHMRDGGSIVNVCSNVMSGRVDRTAYAASKAALAAMTKCWSLELAPRGIRVNAVSPGPVDSPMFRRRRPVGSAEEAAALARIPLGRLLDPDEVGEFAFFLASPRSGSLTGQIITLDGGENIMVSP